MNTSIRHSVILLVLCGIAYPLLVTLIGQLLFPIEANGSLIYDSRGNIRGSYLLAQQFNEDKYFHPRPSTNQYDGANSGGSNLANGNPRLIQRILQDAVKYQMAEKTTLIPVDAITASASGLDPHISLANALTQTNRVASVRHKNPESIKHLIMQLQEKPFLTFLGEPCVNVIRLNLELDYPTTTWD